MEGILREAVIPVGITPVSMDVSDNVVATLK